MIIPEIGEYAEEIATWRRHLHRHPELDLDCHETAAFVSEKLTDFGVDEIFGGYAHTGVIGVVHGRSDGSVTGLRADMDALEILETSDKPWQSEVKGQMHACGHDGHTAMLLAAAKYLCETRKFAGSAVLVFQPGEEASGGGGIMVDQGIMAKFGIEEIYALHTMPNKPAGSFHTRSGSLLASVDDVVISIHGRGGHAAHPTLCDNPLELVGKLFADLDNLRSDLGLHPKECVITPTILSGGQVSNVIPNTVSLTCSIRCLYPETRRRIEKAFHKLSEQQNNYMKLEIDYKSYYPALVNHVEQTKFATRVAREIVGPDAVDDEMTPDLVSEDFSYMLNERPGCFLFLGQGAGPTLHNSAFDFNDKVAPFGASFLARLVERRSNTNDLNF